MLDYEDKCWRLQGYKDTDYDPEIRTIFIRIRRKRKLKKGLLWLGIIITGVIHVVCVIWVVLKAAMYLSENYKYGWILPFALAVAVIMLLCIHEIGHWIVFKALKQKTKFGFNKKTMSAYVKSLDEEFVEKLAIENPLKMYVLAMAGVCCTTISGAVAIVLSFHVHNSYIFVFLLVVYIMAASDYFANMVTDKDYRDGRRAFKALKNM